MNEEQEKPNPWDERYREQRTPWDRGKVSEALLEWLAEDRIPAGRILVPGCGYGHEVIELARRGYRVTGVDVSRSAIRKLRENLSDRGLDADTICADYLHWNPDERFDAVYEQTSLCALPPADWERYAEALARWLKPGGTLFALFMQTGKPSGPPWHCDPVAMQRLFRPPRWRWLEFRGEVAHPLGVHELKAVLRYQGG
jgi:SAM-dependent methyltransferase